MTDSILPVILIVVGFLFIASLSEVVSRKIRLPFTVFLVLVGILVGYIARYYPQNAHWPIFPSVGDFLGTFLKELSGVQVSGELIILVFIPTLIFESAFNMNVRKLIENLSPILILAIPVLVVSTFFVGIVLHWIFRMDLRYALLFGALISATDPVAVIAIFKELGAPKRLAILMEGESLFNDATAIVVFSIILAIIQTGSAALSVPAIGMKAVVDFSVVFLGGVAIGAVMGYLFGLLIGLVRGNNMVVISLTLVLAYASFIVADRIFHVSGIMAVLSAGAVMGGYGRVRISATGLRLTEEFWAYLAFFANSLIFLFVGLLMPSVFRGITGVVFLTVMVTYLVVMLSRVAGIVTIVPFLHRIRLSAPISWAYQFIMFWGGLRGGIALALALTVRTIPGIPEAISGFIFTMTAMIVLLTLVINATTIKPILQVFRLNRLRDDERFLRNEALLSLRQGLKGSLDNLKKEGLFSDQTIAGLAGFFANQIDGLITPDVKLSRDEKERVLARLCTHVQKSCLRSLFQESRLSEPVYKNLLAELESVEDRLVQKREAPFSQQTRPRDNMVLSRILRILRRQTLFQSLIRKFYLRRIAGLYESGRARYIAARFTISTFLSKQTGKSFEKSLIDRALSYYDAVRKKAVDDIREITATFPEYVERAQALLATTIEHSQQERKIFELADLGILNDKVKLDLLDAIDRQIRGLASRPLQGLEFDPEELLVKVPLFAGLSVRQRKKISTLFKTLTLPKGEVLFNQGDDGDSLYIVARGTVEIVRNSRKVSVLSAGAFFGELALLSSIPRTATVTTVHPSILLELSKSKFDRLLDSDQNLKRHIQKVGERRLAEVKKG